LDEWEGHCFVSQTASDLKDASEKRGGLMTKRGLFETGLSKKTDLSKLG
jgi:hypothetical protein